MQGEIRIEPASSFPGREICSQMCPFKPGRKSRGIRDLVHLRYRERASAGMDRPVGGGRGPRPVGRGRPGGWGQPGEELRWGETPASADRWRHPGRRGEARGAHLKNGPFRYRAGLPRVCHAGKDHPRVSSSPQAIEGALTCRLVSGNHLEIFSQPHLDRLVWHTDEFLNPDTARRMPKSMVSDKVVTVGSDELPNWSDQLAKFPKTGE